MIVFKIMAIALIATILIELTLSFILGVRKKDLFTVILVNIVTNPIVVTIPLYINLEFGIISRRIVLIIFEILTVVVEGFIYKKMFDYKKINPYILSLILNVTSYVLGLLLNSLIYWIKRRKVYEKNINNYWKYFSIISKYC